MKRQQEEARGQERIAQLMEEFPEIPRIIVLKTDMLRQGIRRTTVIDKIGKWALPDAHDYFEMDYEDTHSTEDTVEGYTLTPIVCHFREDISYRPLFDSRSPYEICYEERGRYRVYRDGEPMEEVFFPPRPEWYSRKTSSGKPMSSVIGLRAETCMKVAALTYCEYFKDDGGCRYCNINPSEKTKKDLGMQRVVANREQDVYEAFVAGSQEGKIRHVSVSGGVLLDSSKEAEMYARLTRVLKRAMKDVGYDCPIHLKCQALERDDQLKLKEAGVDTIGFNLEVWDELLFPIICPGKAKYVGRERWMERLLQAVEIWGTAESNLVAGVEMAPPYGIKTEDEAAESLIEGWEWIMGHGMSSGMNMFRPVPGSAMAGAPHPRTEFFLTTAQAYRKIALKHGVDHKKECNRCQGQNVFSDW